MFLLLTAYFVLVFLYIYTVAEPSENANGYTNLPFAHCSLDPSHVEFVADKNLFYMQWYHVFGFLWGANVISTMFPQRCADPPSSCFLPFSNVLLPAELPPIILRETRAHCLSLCLVPSDAASGVRGSATTCADSELRYHLGSLALGAFIIALVQIIRLILAYIQRK